MKKTVLLLTVMLIVTVSCQPAPTPTALIGKWEVPPDGSFSALELSKDAKFEFRYLQENFTGTYEVRDNKIRLNVSGDPNKQIVLNYKFDSEDKMQISFERGYVNSYITFVKKK